MVVRAAAPMLMNVLMVLWAAMIVLMILTVFNILGMGTAAAGVVCVIMSPGVAPVIVRFTCTFFPRRLFTNRPDGVV